MTGKEAICDVIGELCGEKADGSTRTGIVPMVTITTHTIDRCECRNTIARDRYPR